MFEIIDKERRQIVGEFETREEAEARELRFRCHDQLLSFRLAAVEIHQAELLAHRRDFGDVEALVFVGALMQPTLLESCLREI
jgi:hypothetical protein